MALFGLALGALVVQRERKGDARRSIAILQALVLPARAGAGRWAKIKATEKAKKGALDGIPRSVPALVRAMRAGEKAGAVGFDRPDAASVRAKVDEELAEFSEACASGDRAAMDRELGDLLFAIVNLARKLDLDAEHDLRETTDRFGRRFANIEGRLEAPGRSIKSASPVAGRSQEGGGDLEHRTVWQANDFRIFCALCGEDP